MAILVSSGGVLYRRFRNIFLFLEKKIRQQILNIISDDEHENAFGKGRKKQIIDRHFNPEGIEYLVHYVRKNVKLFDDKSFMDFKLCANIVDTHNTKLLHEQRIFRGFTPMKIIKMRKI